MSSAKGRQPEVAVEYYRYDCHRYTFQDPVMRDWVEQRLEGRVLNLFAGKTVLRHDDEIVRNDIDEEIDADYHFDAINVGEHFPDNSFDTVVLDPPYSLYTANQYYDGEYVGQDVMSQMKDALATIIRPGGKLLQLGYNTTGMGRRRRFKRTEVAVFNHMNMMRDTVASTHVRCNEDLRLVGDSSG